MKQLERINEILKDYITSMISSNRHEEAQALLKEYKRMLKDDIDDFFDNCSNAIEKAKLADIQSIFQQNCEFNKTKNYMKQQPVILNQEPLPKVSIIIPTYNRKDMLKEAVESAIAQDYPNLEIIVSDNASTDGTERMILNKKTAKIKYICHNKNRGATFNVANAIGNIATGKYILVLHDDDYLIDNNYISKAMLLLLANPTVVLVHANCKILNIHTNKIECTQHQGTRITRGIDYFINYERPGYDHIVGFVTALCNREKIIDSGFLTVPECYGGDTVMYLYLMLAGDVGIIDDCAGLYRYHQDNMSNNLNCYNYDATICELEKLKTAALQKGVPLEIMNEWINFRIWRYVTWIIATYFSCNNIQRGINVLNSIAEKYPAAYQAIRHSLNI